MISRGEKARPARTTAAGRTRLADGIEPAQAAAGRSGDVAPSLGDPLGPVGPEPHPKLDAVIELDDVEGLDLVGRLHDAFAQAEAHGEVAEVLGRAHHHGVGAAIIGQRERRLLRDQARAVAEDAVTPDFPP
ncbi:hypothetical protein ACVMDO_005544 [Bradyrhizobium sp. USDA 4513]